MDTADRASEIQLTGLQRAEFAKASQLLTYSFFIQAAIAVLSGLASFISGDTLAYVVAIALLGLAIGWGALTLMYRASPTCAERARRYSLVVDGLGLRVGQNEMLQRKTSFTVAVPAGSKYEDPNYYASREPSGPKRLKEMLEESIFWSLQLAKYSKNRLIASCCALGLIFIFSIISIVAVDSSSRVVIARAVAAAVSAMILTGLISDACAFSEEAKALELLSTRFEHLADSLEITPELVLLLTDYNSIVEGAPMFMPGLYKQHEAAINKLWSTRK